MKKAVFLILLTFSIGLLLLQSCGPVVITARPSNPPPPWFYPNRIEQVRYIYFPDYTIYYDLSLRSYIYLDNGIWISASVLPARYKHLNLRRSKQVRINNYFGDNIKRYHDDNRGRINRRSSTTRRTN